MPPRKPVLLALCALLAACPGLAIEWATVGDPGNPCGAWFHECHGSVAEVYRIGKTEVTNAEYAEFLDAVAATDTHGLYNPAMGPEGFEQKRPPRRAERRRALEGREHMLGVARGGIARSGAEGSFRYTAIEGRERKPVTFVSFWDAVRYANWLHNGRPSGAQHASTTEDGAYTLTPEVLKSGWVTRNAETARFYIPTFDEWYKAAYYDTGSRTWYDYPASSNEVPRCTPPGPRPNTANCEHAVDDLTDAGAYTESVSPNGTWDQGGNVFEWHETVYYPIPVDTSKHPHRMLKGGSFHRSAHALKAANKHRQFPPDHEGRAVGFRVASRAEAGDARAEGPRRAPTAGH